MGVALTGIHRLNRVLPLVLMAMIGLVVWMNAERREKVLKDMMDQDIRMV